MRILAVDPGGTTGWAVYNDELAQPVYAGQDDFERFTHVVVHLPIPDVIVAERFTINQQTIRHSQQTTALEVIGFLRYWAWHHGAQFVLQTPADAKRFAQVGSAKDARLDTLGWTVRPKAEWDHANDALRHLLLYMVKAKLIEVPRA